MRRRQRNQSPRFDAELAPSVVGKTVLVGLTYVRADGSVERRSQLHGRIVRADAESIAIDVEGADETFTLPPDLRSLEPAPPGDYRLKTTGQIVVDPDYLTTWTITEPPK